MNSQTFLAFGDELTKIAMFQKVRSGFINALKEGWKGTPEQIARGEGQKWFGEGKALGGFTRYLPIGGKAMTAVGIASMLPSALRRNDPTGQERSRTERVTGLAGNTVGGLAGSAAMMRAFPRSNFIAPLVGGIVGGSAGERAVTAPFHMFNRPQPAPAPAAQPVPNPGYPA